MASSEEIIGLVSAALASLCFGSYGVPMKGEAATRVDVDPLVFQTYKAVAVLVSVVQRSLVVDVAASRIHTTCQSYLNFSRCLW